MTGPPLVVSSVYGLIIGHLYCMTSFVIGTIKSFSNNTLFIIIKVGKIPAQTQLQTALAINMGSEGKQVEISHVVCC